MNNFETDINQVTKEETNNAPKKPPRYSVVLLNSDYVAFPSVLYSLSKAFNIDSDGAMQLASTAHIHGQATIATYSKDIAETKADIAFNCLQEHHVKLTGEEPTQIFSLIPFDE